MRQTKKLTYTAVSTAIAVIALTISAFTPVLLIPVLIVALCFFIAFQCSIVHGFLAVAATLTLAFFIAGGSVLTPTFIFASILASPYAIIAHFIKRLDYSKKKPALIRASIAIVFFNIMFALIVFIISQFLGEFLFNADLNFIFNRLGGIVWGYLILAVLGTALMIFYDITFILAARVLNKHLRFWVERVDKKEEENTEENSDKNIDPFDKE